MRKRNFNNKICQSIAVCSIDDIPSGAAKGYVPNPRNSSMRVIVLKSADRYHVYENRCPHVGTPLDWVPDQFLDDSQSLIQCATHGALFRIEDGFCVAGPCTGQSLKSIPFEIRKNQIVIDTQ